MNEPYIYHFPDGNASIARLLVRSLVPAAMPGSTMEDIVLTKARYEELDRPRHRVRIRLNSTVVRVVERVFRCRTRLPRPQRPRTASAPREARRDGVLQHADPARARRTRGRTDRGLEAEREIAAGVFEGAGAQLAAVGRARGARDLRRVQPPFAGQAGLSGGDGRLPQPGRAGRTDGVAHGARADGAGHRRTARRVARVSPPAAAGDVRRPRGGDPPRPLPYARSRRIP